MPPAGDRRETAERHVVVGEPRQHGDREGREHYQPLRRAWPRADAENRPHDEADACQCDREQHEDRAAQRRERKQSAQPDEPRRPAILERPHCNPHRDGEPEGGPDLGHHQRAEVWNRRKDGDERGGAERNPFGHDTSGDRVHDAANRGERQRLREGHRPLTHAEHAIQGRHEYG